MNELIKKAKEAMNNNGGRIYENYSKERLELALSYLNQEITPRGISAGLGFKKTDTNRIYSFISSTLRQAVYRGDITITLK